MSHVRATVQRTALVLALALGCLLVLPSTARAADELGLSNDGVHWDGTLAPLFDADERWVPGDVRTATFHVRNQGTDAGILDVDLLARDRGPLLGTGQLSVVARAGEGPWTDDAASGQQVLVDGVRLPAGGRVAVTVRVALAAAAPNDTMLLAADLDFRVRLTDATATEPGGPDETSGPGDNDNTGDADGGLLPDTGTAVQPGLVWVALALTGFGGFLVARRRDRRTEDPHA